MSLDSMKGPDAKQQLKGAMVDFLEKARAKVPPDAWQRANDSLGAIATAVSEQNSPEGPLKTFINLVGHPPFNTDDDLVTASENIERLARNAAR